MASWILASTRSSRPPASSTKKRLMLTWSFMVPSTRRSIARQIVSGPSSISLAPRPAATPSRTRAAASWSRKARPKASRGEFPAAVTKNAYSDCECANRKNGRLPNVTTLQCQSTVDTVSGTGASPDGVSRSLTCAFFVHLKFIESRSERLAAKLRAAARIGPPILLPCPCGGTARFIGGFGSIPRLDVKTLWRHAVHYGTGQKSHGVLGTGTASRPSREGRRDRCVGV